MKQALIYIAGFCLATVFFTCKEPYALPATILADGSFLVVDGKISVTGDQTDIILTRTKTLDDNSSLPIEFGAHVIVETDNGGSYPLREAGGGHYGLATLPPGTGTEKYRLNITTRDNRQYLSDYVAYKKAPAIDSISWEQYADGVHIYVNSHDAEGKSKYYKWEYVETWEYHAPFQSVFEYKPDTIVARDRSRLFFACYRTIPSSAIITQSTAKLSSDVVYKKEVMFVPASTEKIGVKYSLLVKQTVLTEDGFNYWVNLSKITEQLGSLFDAQPSQISGNIHCVTNPAETVIGFVTATSTEQQRVFIDRVQLSDWAYPPGSFSICDTIHLTDDERMSKVISGSYWVVDLIGIKPPYWAAPVECTDCRLKGGSITKPSFWP